MLTMLRCCKRFSVTMWLVYLAAAAVAMGLGGCATPGPGAASGTGGVQVSGATPVTLPLDEQLALFLRWFPGEYDNHEQHWQDKLDGVEQVHEHLHHVFLPVSAPAIGPHTFFVRQTMNGDPDNVYRLRLYSFSLDPAEQAIRLDIFSYRDEARYRDAHRDPGLLAGITRDELIERPGCEVYWAWQNDHFHGYMKDKACAIESRRSNRMIYVTDDLRLTDSEIWIRDEAFYADGSRVFGNRAGIHHKNRKVQYYSGWAGVSTTGPAFGQDEANWTQSPAGWNFTGELDVFGRFTIHNEGQVVALERADGSPSGYSVQLAKLTYQNTTTPILTLKILDDATGRTLAYSWAATDSARVGINTRWAQAGLTVKPGRPSWGFEPVVQPPGPEN